MKGKENHTNHVSAIKELERLNAILKTDIEKYHTFFDNAPLGIFRATLGGKYIEANNTFAHMLGYEAPIDLIRSVSNIGSEVFVHKSERKRIIKKLMSGNGHLKHKTFFKRKNSTLFPVCLYFTLVRGKDNKSLYLSCIVEDISEQRNTEEHLIQERNQLKVLIDSIPDFIYLKDIEGKFILSNQAFEKLFDVSDPAELLGKSGNELKTSPLVAEFISNDDLVLREGKAINNHEISIMDKRKKKTFYYYSSKVPLTDTKGKISGLLGIGRDITEIKQAQGQISISQANLTSVLESTKNLIWSVNSGLTIVTANSPFRDFFRRYYRKEINVGDNILKSLPENSRLKWKSYFGKALKGEQFTREEVYLKDRISTFYEITFCPILDSKHHITGVTVIATNITERKITEDAIRESEEIFRQLAENTTDVFLLSGKNTILYANPAFERVYGRTVEELISNPSILLDVVYDPDKKEYQRHIKKVLDAKKPGKGIQYRIQKPNGEIKNVWTRIFPVKDNLGKVYRYVYVISDMTELKELEATIITTRNQQKAILDNIPYLAWLKDNNGKYIIVNEPFARLYNKEVADIIGKTDYDLCAFELAEDYERNDEEVKKSGKRQLLEQVEEFPKGHVWSETFKTPIYDEKGEVIGITGISRDISERKVMEETLREREEHFRALLQNSSDAISILDKDGIIIFESSYHNKILDFDRDELLNKPIFKTVHPDDVESFRITFDEVLNNPKKQIKKEYRSLHKNKRWIYVESIFSNQLSNPFIKGIIVNSRDITERKMGELKERVYHDNLIFLSNSALDLLGLSSKDDIYDYIAEKLFNFLEDAIVIVTSYQEGDNSFHIEKISGLSAHMDDIIRILGGSMKDKRFDVTSVKSGVENAGTIFTVQDEFLDENMGDISRVQMAQIKELLKVHKIYNIGLARHNKLLGNVTILMLNKSIIKFKHIIETFIHQVSVVLHRSLLEYELVKAKERAEESDKLKTAFLTNMSHEIRTPMNGILGFAEMLNDDSLSPANRKKYLEIINSNGKMLVNLIDDIIDFAKIEAGQLSIMEDDFSLNNVLDQVHSSFLTQYLRREKSELKIRVRKAFPNENSYIHSDSTRIRQILTNLIGNSIKFTQFGFIEFGYQLKKPNELLFYVKDTGIGIPKEKLNLIFERFMQADSSSTRKYGGSGLGLAISKGLVELLGGKMWAESTVNIGSTFYFAIPYTPAVKKEEDKEEKKKPKTNYSWEGRTFLIAEDDKFSYKFLEGFLKQTHANVIHAADGIEAVNLCRSNNKIDLVLMDIQMPEMNGFEATEEIKKFNKSIPVIAQTANAITEERQKCLNAGCDDFISKPININELYAKIDKWLSIKHYG
ncbi:MAG: PAS domain S-box protein [Bacteroidales bacterium]|nr:PAS domain S-box protein [Bacteroidales bacterium]